MADWRKYLSDADRRALGGLEGGVEVAQPHLVGPAGDMPVNPSRSGSPSRPGAIGPDEEKALRMLAEGDMFPEPDLAGPQSRAPEQGGQAPPQPQAPGRPANAGGGLATPSPPQQGAGQGGDPLAEAREQGSQRGRNLNVLAGISRLFGGGGGVADQVSQQAEVARQRPVQEAKERLARERQARQDEFQRRMAEQNMGLKRQQVEGSQQAQQMKAQQAQEMRDPNSETSRRAQQAVKQMFGDAIPDEVLQQMSAAELQEGGNPVMAAAKKAKAAQLGQEQFEQRREAKLEDYKTKREAAFPYDMAIARAKASMKSDRYAEELAMRSAVQRDMEKMKAGERMDRKKRDEVAEYAKLAIKTDLPSQVRLVEKARKLANEMKEETGEIFGLRDEVIRRLPVEMRGMMSEKAAKLQMLISQLTNIQLKERSGAAVTRNEMERFREELGQDLMANEEKLMTGLNNAHRYLTERHQDLMGGFSPEVHEAYERNYESARERLAEEEEGAGQPAPKDEPADVPEDVEAGKPDAGGAKVRIMVEFPGQSPTPVQVPKENVGKAIERIEGQGGKAQVME